MGDNEDFLVDSKSMKNVEANHLRGRYNHSFKCGTLFNKFGNLIELLGWLKWKECTTSNIGVSIISLHDTPRLDGRQCRNILIT